MFLSPSGTLAADMVEYGWMVNGGMDVRWKKRKKKKQKKTRTMPFPLSLFFLCDPKWGHVEPNLKLAVAKAEMCRAKKSSKQFVSSSSSPPPPPPETGSFHPHLFHMHCILGSMIVNYVYDFLWIKRLPMGANAWKWCEYLTTS